MSFRTLQVQLRDKQALSPITGSHLLKTSGDIKKSYFVKTARSRLRTLGETDIVKGSSELLQTVCT